VGETTPELDGKEEFDLPENHGLRIYWLAGNISRILFQWEYISLQRWK
jgi:hypothetical protein